MRRSDVAPHLQAYLVHPEDYPHAWAMKAPPTPRQLPIVLGQERLHAQAYEALGRLREAMARIPNAQMVTRTLARREAVKSSQIEGTQSGLADLLSYETTQGADGLPADVRITEAYVRALDLGILHLARGSAIDLALVLKLHECLMQGERATIKIGAWRERQAWIGSSRIEEATFVPSPAAFLQEAMLEFEQNALNYQPADDEQTELSLLAELAIVHAQFETIHPFQDGNGRVGRLLLPLKLHLKALAPLYVSGTLLARRSDYYAALLDVQLRGSWSGWVKLLSEAVLEACTESVSIAEDLLALTNRWAQTLKGVRSDSAIHKVLPFLIGYPVTTVEQTARILKVSNQAANTALNRLLKEGVLELIDESRDWGRVFRAGQVLERVDRPPSTEHTRPLSQ